MIGVKCEYLHRPVGDINADGFTRVQGKTTRPKRYNDDLARTRHRQHLRHQPKTFALLIIMIFFCFWLTNWRIRSYRLIFGRLWLFVVYYSAVLLLYVQYCRLDCFAASTEH